MDVWMERSAGAPAHSRSPVVRPWGCRHESTPHQHHYKRKEEERVKKRNEEMENDTWPFYFSKSHATISHISLFWM